MAEATTQPTFGPGLFSFLSDLRANNNREWFAANRQRYEEHLLEPALAFIDAFAPRLGRDQPVFPRRRVTERRLQPEADLLVLRTDNAPPDGYVS